MTIRQHDTQPICPPDLSARPFQACAEHQYDVAPDVLFHAWTEQFDRWFAAPGAIRMRAEVNEPYFFEVVHEGQRYPHYGRFLRVERDRLIELTWLNDGGTHGAETVLTIELSPHEAGTLLRLTHAGFRDQADSDAHETAWQRILEGALKPVVTNTCRST